MRVFKWLGFVLAAWITGALASKPVVAWIVDRTAIHNGPWRSSLGTGSAGATRYERTAIAVAGLYALAKEETVYYTAFVDDEGRPLEGRCDYRLSGRPFPARWWSLTMYGADSYLVANAANIYSRHAANLEFASDGSYVIPVSARNHPLNWLPAPDGGAFSITLRLYNPSAAIYSSLSSITLPSVERETCR